MASTDDLRALVRKYEEIVRLRRADGDGHDPRPAMAALALEFPGALREADALPMAELEHRIAALREVAAGNGRPAPWMDAMARFHALARGALAVKAWLGGRKAAGPDGARQFQEALLKLRHRGDAVAWTPELERVANPPRGRLLDLVFERLAEERGVTVAEARRLVLARECERGDGEVD